MQRCREWRAPNSIVGCLTAQVISLSTKHPFRDGTWSKSPTRTVLDRPPVLASLVAARRKGERVHFVTMHAVVSLDRRPRVPA